MCISSSLCFTQDFLSQYHCTCQGKRWIECALTSSILGSRRCRCQFVALAQDRVFLLPWWKKGLVRGLWRGRARAGQRSVLALGRCRQGLGRGRVSGAGGRGTGPCGSAGAGSSAVGASARAGVPRSERKSRAQLLGEIPQWNVWEFISRDILLKWKLACVFTVEVRRLVYFWWFRQLMLICSGLAGHRSITG